MNYAAIAIITWIILTILIAILAKRSVFKQFGIPQNSVGSPLWRAYLITCAAVSMLVSIGITYLIKSVAQSLA